MRYNTGNPVEPNGSSDPRDLFDNAGNFDLALNATSNQWFDRLGRSRKSWTGFEQDVYNFLANSGFELPPLEYVDGSPLTVDRPTQLIERDGVLYSVRLPAEFPVELSGNWAVDETLLVMRVDQSLRQDLANDSGPDSGSDKVGHEGATVYNLIGDRMVLKNGATVAEIIAAIATGREVVIPEGVDITIDNSAAIGLTIAVNNARITGKGRILATSDNFDLIRVTGQRAWIEHIELVGPGTYDPTVVDGNPPALLRLQGDRCTSYRVRYTEPYSCGLLIKQAAGCRALYNTVKCSYAGSIAIPSLFGIYTHVTSDATVRGNQVVGCIQGISGGGNDVGSITVTGLDGIVSSKARNTLIDGNFCVNQLDHSIYFSNSSENTIIDRNIVGSVNSMIKIEGGPNTVTDNIGTGGEGIQGRNVFNTLIQGNQFVTTKSSANAYGILLFDTVFKRNSTGIRILDNVLSHGAGISSAGGILVQGQVWDGFQAQLGDLDISNNRVKGYGSVSEGIGIGIDQTLFAGSPVMGSWAEGITISNNTVTMPTSAADNYACLFRNAVRYMTFTGNTLINFRTNGVRLLGVADSTFTGNTLIADPAATGVFGFFERAKDLTTHFNSANNNYGNNTYKGTFGRRVQHSDETCFNADRMVLRRTGSLSTDTIAASQWPKQLVYNNHSAGAVITLDALTSAPWPIDSDLTISNAHASNSLTVNPGGFAVAAGTSLRLVGTGSNAWIKAN
ncbi:right-handed parallel beta-helix repeat-containing protein [Pseudomonas sp. MT3]